jgi:hypothetical protein
LDNSPGRPANGVGYDGGWSAKTVSQAFERILEEVRGLTDPERTRLLRELENRILARAHTKPAAVGQLFGKYAFVPTSSDAFCSRKADELELEDRRGRS